MKVQAEISIYPLRVKSLSEPIEEFCNILRDNGLEVKTTTMSSSVAGEADVVFASVREAFGKISEKYGVVLNMKVTNACSDKIEKNP
jgi:uncharacterized protein YqgV (UPF0045/DUF77 family)